MGAGKLSRAFQGIQNGLGRAVQAMKSIDQALEHADPTGLRWKLAKEAAAWLTPYVRQHLLQNFAAAGIQNHTGKLRAAVASTVVGVTKNGLVVRFPPGLDEKLYRVGSSINYGAVRRPKGVKIGERAARSIKKAVLRGKKVSEKTLQEVNQVHDGRKLHRARIDMGGVSVIRPKPFYYLTAAQKKDLEALFMGRFRHLLQRNGLWAA